MRQKSIPCYVNNFGVHNVLNIPLGMFQRITLKKFLRELDKRQREFQTFFVAEATPATISLVRGLLQILEINLKLKGTRRKAEQLLTAHEKNLKHIEALDNQQAEQNLVALSISCGLIGLCFLLAAHIEYLSQL